VLRDADVDARRLELVITETSLMVNPKRAVAVAQGYLLAKPMPAVPRIGEAPLTSCGTVSQVSGAEESDERTHDRSAFLAALGNEYFALQTLRASSIGEAGSRAALFFTTLTGTVVALGFLAGQPEAAQPFAYAAMPIVAIVGLLSFLRLVEISVEDVAALRAMNRIRAFYSTLDTEAARFFTSPTSGQAINQLMSTGAHKSKWQAALTISATVAVVEALLVGAATAFAVGDGTGSVPASVAAGAVSALVVGVLLGIHQQRRFAQVLAEDSAF
jgi:hypothetical protein